MRRMVPGNLTLDNKDNLITLCQPCHSAYDVEYPFWVIITMVDVLNRYINHGRRNYRGRVAAAVRGEVLQRTLPTVDITNVVYHRFILEAGWASIITSPNDEALERRTNDSHT